MWFFQHLSHTNQYIISDFFHNREASYNNEIYNQVIEHYFFSRSIWSIRDILLTFHSFRLSSLEDKVSLMGGQSLPVYGLPYTEKIAEHRLAREYRREMEYDQEELAIRTEQLQSNLTNGQHQVCNAFLEMLEQENVPNKRTPWISCFSMHRGITGETYLINLILSKIRSQGKIVLATASSGITATLLQGGRTLRVIFKIPLDLTWRYGILGCSGILNIFGWKYA